MTRQKLVLGSLWLLLLANYLERVAISFAGPSIMAALSMTPRTFGAVLSAFGIGYLLAQIPGGLLADRYGARRMLVIAAVLWAFFTGLTGLTVTVTAFVVVRFLFGLSEGVVMSSFYKTIGDNFEPAKRARAVSIGLTAIAVAPACAGPLVGGLVAHSGWQAMFLWMMIPALLAALCAYFFIPQQASVALAEPDPPEERGGYIDVLKQPSLWLLSLAAFAWNIPYWGFLGWMPSYLAMARGIDLKMLGMLAAIPYVFAFLGILAFGWLGSRLPRHCTYIVAGGFAAAALSLAGAYRAETVPSAIAGLSAAAFFLFGVGGPIGKISLDLAPARRRAAFVGTYGTAGQISSALAPGVIGFLVSETGNFGSGFTLMAVSLGLSAVCLLALTPAAARGHRAGTLPA
ncbi:MFS transporter [Sphingomonas sp. SRS2]|uniref:MFS transporter n=1 Tax=Sphingomonas sp. SRS2 TaxID=133190 RepID=UPI0006184BB4|nr:MFS transporter [Sphingomonas sp. SRS2]KKC26641.1 hypothetical protein WP12_06720 [Sphingomonas sp. SRS2]